MSYQYPPALNQLINALTRLPGVGAKAASRLAFHLLAEDKQTSYQLADAIRAAADSVHPCPQCGNFTDHTLCPICVDSRRDRTTICVVEQVADLISLEKAGSYNGLYQVLGGAISPLDGIGPDALNIGSLLSRVADGSVKEVILATNPTVEGEATATYIANRLAAAPLRVSRLALGMPVGGALAFTDEATLDLALSGRKPI